MLEGPDKKQYNSKRRQVMKEWLLSTAGTRLRTRHLDHQHECLVVVRIVFKDTGSSSKIRWNEITKVPKAMYFFYVVRQARGFKLKFLLIVLMQLVIKSRCEPVKRPQRTNWVLETVTDDLLFVNYVTSTLETSRGNQHDLEPNNSFLSQI